MLSSAIYNKSPGIQTFVRGNPIFAPAATLAGPPVRTPVLPAHETASTDREGLPRLSREQEGPAHETTLVGSPVSEPGLPAHETTLADPPVSEPVLPAHETTSTDPPVSKPGLPAHETALAGPPVSEPVLPAHETALAGLPVSRTGLSTHEEGVRKYVVRRMIDN